MSLGSPGRPDGETSCMVDLERAIGLGAPRPLTCKIVKKDSNFGLGFGFWGLGFGVWIGAWCVWGGCGLFLSFGLGFGNAFRGWYRS